MTTDPLVPVTVVGGYLGAGKTTVIASLLAGAGGRRLAVLVNDFGSLNLDAALLRSAPAPDSRDGPTASTGDGPEVVELTNGCVCCSLADSLGDGLDRVLALDPRPDHIVIEASGVADPGRLAAYGQGWPGVRLDAVVTVAAADQIRDRADDRFVGTTVRRQLAAADLVLLTRRDLLRPPNTERGVRSWLAPVVDGTPVLNVDHGDVAPDLLLESGTAPPAHRPRPGPDGERVGIEPEPDPRHQATTLALPSVVDLDRLVAVVGGWPETVVRVKGLAVDDDGVRHVLHRVGRRVSTQRWPDPGGPVPDPVLVVLTVADPERPPFRPSLGDLGSAHP